MVTRVADKSDPVPDDVWEEAVSHYDEKAISALGNIYRSRKRFEEVSIAEIATAAGTAAGSIGYHFGSVPRCQMPPVR